MSALLAGVLLAAPASSAFALDPARRLSQAVHRIWQVPQGLPDATVYAVVQGPDGYLWLGTESGLVRFDGVQFVRVDHLGGLALPKMRVQALAIDAHQTLWIGTGGFGVIHDIDADHARHFLVADGLPSNDVHCVVPDGDRVWACTARGLAEISSSRVVSRGVPAGWGGASVDAACVSRDGGVWIGGDGAMLASWAHDAFHPIVLTSIDRMANVRALHCGADGDVWAGSSAGVVRFNPTRETEQVTTAANGLASDAVLSLGETRDGSLLAGTTNGFSRISASGIDSLGPSDGLSQSSVYALLEDREGSLWVGTKHGLNQFLDGRAVPYTTVEGLPSNDTGPIVQDARGRIWVGTMDAGLGIFDGGRVSTMTSRDGLRSNRILSLAMGSDGDLWVGTDRGLDRVRDRRIVASWSTGRSPAEGRVTSINADAGGSTWFATPSGLWKLPRDATSATRPLSVVDSPVAAIGSARDGALFAATDSGGLDEIGDGRRKSLLPAEALLRHVDALFEDDQGALWIGTIGDGVRLLDHGRLTSFRVSDGLFDDTVYGIVADEHGRLWMACSKGIFSVSRADLLKFAAGETTSFSSTPYSPTDALRTIECKSGVQPAVWRMRDGTLWFSTIRGVLTLDPSHLDRKLASPPAVIEDVTIDGETTAASALSSLSPGPKNVDFRYTGLSLVVPARLTFRYRLEGFDKEWIDAGTRRQAFYTNLPHGQYRFLLRACLPDGPCSDAPSVVALGITPRVYERAWFLPLVAFGLAAAGWGLYRRRIQRLRANFALVLAERTRIARELHDTLLQGFSGVAMATKATADRLPPSAERHALEDIVSDTTDCLRDARRTLAGLRGEEVGLAPAVTQAARQLTDGTPVALGLRIDACRCAMPASTEYQLVRITHEAIANAVKHAAASTVEVSLESTPQLVRLRITDNGRGFDPTSPPPGHYGLVGMRERAAEIGAALEFTGGHGRGTVVSILWPHETS